MKVAGVITEYNPFHNGHKYQLEEIRRQTGADYIIAAMSGDFVQRGAPAILDKYERARMALENGADLVLELPTLYATSSAEGFARGGVATLLSTGLLNYLCFGAETNDLNLMTRIAAVLNDEPAIYIEELQTRLRAGDPFPVARSKALCVYFSVEGGEKEHWIRSILEQPNNILAIEYLRQLLINGAADRVEPILIPRVGSRYHDVSVDNRNRSDASSDGSADSTQVFASATAIRRMLKEHTDSLGSNKVTFIAADSMYDDEDMDDDALFDAMQASYQGTSSGREADSNGLAKGLMDYVPQDAIIPLIFGSREHQLLFEDSTSQMLAYRLQMLRADYRRTGILPVCGDCSEDLMHRILGLVDQFRTTSQFIELVKNKSVTYSHISRALLQILLQVTPEMLAYAKEHPGYIRVLGFRKEVAELLGHLSGKASVPVITKPVDYKAKLSPVNSVPHKVPIPACNANVGSACEAAASCFELDLLASEVYNQLIALQGGTPCKNDFSHPLIIQ